MAHLRCAQNAELSRTSEVFQLSGKESDRKVYILLAMRAKVGLGLGYRKVMKSLFS